jgi:hypothetical protein
MNNISQDGYLLYDLRVTCSCRHVEILHSLRLHVAVVSGEFEPDNGKGRSSNIGSSHV